LAALVTFVAYFVLKKSNRESQNISTPVSASFTQLTYQPGPEFFPSLSPDGKTLAYASHTSGNWDIHIQRIGETNPINLTQNSLADDSQPAFSPDGNRIAFRSERDGGGIYLMSVSGDSVVRVSDFGYSPSWSPDSAQILVGTEKIPQPSTKPTKSQLWTIDLKSNERKLLFEGDALQPHYSPNKYRIAFWSRPNKYGQREDIWTVPAQGGQAERITSGATSDLNPIWSPDGKHLYFSSSRGGSVNVWRVAVDEKSGATLGEPEAVTAIGAITSALQLSFSRDGKRLVYIAQTDVRNLRKIAFDPVNQKVAGEPVWISRGSLQLWFPDPSPDGEWLAACSRGDQRHVYIMRTDGTELRDLTNDNFRNDGWPRWSPDGNQIAFTSRRTGDYELWLINRDGSGLRQLTDSKGGHYSPWSPDGKTIAYSTHVPKHDCIIIEADKPWSEQKLRYLSPLTDASVSFEGWAFSHDGKRLAGIRHLPNGSHSGIGIYDLASGQYDWLTDFGDWPVWLNDDRRLLFVSQGKILVFDIATRKYQEVFTVTDQDVDIGSPSISPDNRTMYFTFVAAEADIWLMTFN
jgi:Tol biopolymer transport system component